MRQFDDLDRQVVTALRVLAVDQVEQARSGHPGLPLGAAPMAYALWSRFLRFDPDDPEWPDRDRFVLSAGHGSALLYTLLHLFGYDLPLEELKRFRQWGSRTPGHPEFGHTPGVEVTTGPLGQGFAHAAGMALAERHLAARFNQDGYPIVNHRTWVLASDGDLMEGISHEAASIAGHLRLGRLVVLYDDNRITIEGPTSLAWSDDVGRRFEAYGWRVLHVEDGNDLDAIAPALSEAAAHDDAPVLVRVRTHIGFGSPKQDDAASHGAPLGAEAARATRAALGWTIPEPFVVPPAVYQRARALADHGREAHKTWLASFSAYQTAYPELATELARRWRGELPADWDEGLPDFAGVAGLATREASGQVLNALAKRVPELLGGSADLAPSNNTLLKGEADIAPGAHAGRNVHFGVREHAMAAVANGLALHGGVRPYAATFLVFADYMRPALRLAALMKLPVVYVFTHDSIALGEDGPTHQPIEHLVSLRIIPDMVVLRPADAHETAQAWAFALARRDGPCALILTRQKLPVLPALPTGTVARGAFVRAEAANGSPDTVLLATGSEVSLALAARDNLEADGIATRVVSAPSLELFARQDPVYQRAVLGPGHALRVAIEAGRGQGWHRWVGDGELIVLRTFGASAPGDEAMRRFGFSPEAVTAEVKAALVARRPAPLVVSAPESIAYQLGEHGARLTEREAMARLESRDATLWGVQHAGHVAKRLGWLDLPARSRAALPALERLVVALAADGAQTLYLLGMGGSSLAPQVLREILGNPSGREIVVLDTTDPDRVGAVLDALDPARAAVLAVSKSGTTAETSALLEILWHRIHTQAPDPGPRFLAVTEPGTPLERLARERGFHACLPHPVDVGGRFSALSAVGLLPALWLGHDAEAILSAGARALDLDAPNQPAVALATLLAAAATDGWGFLAWCASPSLAPFGAWAEQLVAESTGKDGRGVLPVMLAAPPAPSTAWSRTVYLSPRFADEDTAALDAALDSLEAAGHAVARWALPRHGLGELFVGLELATALTGLLLDVNPFDEPDVVRAKERARTALKEGGGARAVATVDPGGSLAAHVARVRDGDAIVLLAYLPENTANATALEALAETLQRRHRVPVTYAFGPRYLHSTGQLHKGGPDRIVPIVLSADPERDVAIPGERHTLGALRLAQARGDVAALADVGRRVLHLHLAAPVPEAIETLIAAAR